MAGGKNQKLGKHHSRPVTSLQFLAIILITVVLAVVLDFGHRAAVSAELKKEAQRLESQVATLDAEHAALMTQREWVQTDAYIEEWARTEGGMVLRGETPVVPVPTGQVAAAQGATPWPASNSKVPSNEAEEIVVQATSSHWAEWWALFFGSDE